MRKVLLGVVLLVSVFMELPALANLFGPPPFLYLKDPPTPGFPSSGDPSVVRFLGKIRNTPRYNLPWGATYREVRYEWLQRFAYTLRHPEQRTYTFSYNELIGDYQNSFYSHAYQLNKAAGPYRYMSAHPADYQSASAVIVPASSEINPPIRTQPAGSPPPPPLSIVEAFRQARQEFRQGRYESAATHYHSAVRLQPGNAVAQMGLALASLATEDYATAATALAAALDRHPTWHRQPISLLTFYKKASEFDEQLSRLETYVHDHPEDQDAQFLLGYGRLLQGNSDRAREAFQRRVEEQPDSPQTASTLEETIAPKTPSSTKAVQP